MKNNPLFKNTATVESPVLLVTLLRMPKTHGFTIVELLIVIVVIGILAAITVVAFGNVSNQAKAASLKSDLVGAMRELESYRVEYGAYPTSIDGTYCPVPADTNYCLKASTGNQFTNYTVNNSSSPQTVALNAVNASGDQYFASNTVPAGSSSDTFTMAAITGGTTTGSTLTAGTLTPPAATVTRQWQRASAAGGPWTDIAGATSTTYVLPSGDRGQYIRHVATGTGTYSGVATSAATAQIKTNVTSVGTPTGTTTSGSTLTAGTVAPAGATVSYQWKRGGTAISGATASTYVLTSSDVGFAMSVTVTGTGTYASSATSGSTAVVN